MEYDQRILDIIAASSDSRPADVAEPFNALIGERIADAIAERKTELAASYFGDVEESVDIEELEDITDEDLDGQDA